MSHRVLFADNDVDFLDTRAEFLEQAGYDVIKTATLSEAEWLLKNTNIHLAILDIRMRDDNDDRDESGLALAMQTAYRLIPKIILTGHESADAVRVAMKRQSGDFTPAIDFIYKAEGPEALVAAVNNAFIHHVQINWKLIMKPEGQWFSLVTQIAPNLEGERLLNHAEELEDLFRRLFFEKDYIRIDRLLWQRDGRLALVVFAFKEDTKPESFIVVCGQSVLVTEEMRHLEEFAPKVPGNVGTVLTDNAETTHFAANAYSIVGNDLEKTQTLYDLYRYAPEKTFNDTLTMLFQYTLQEWHQGKPFVEKNNTLETLYGQRLELTEESFSKVDFEERINIIMSQIATIGSRIARTDKVLTFQFANESLSFPNPLLISSQTRGRKEDVLVINVPGRLTGENILTGESGHAWLTDFADAGMAPLFWNFCALEATIRFDWTDTTALLRRYELENCFLNTDFAKPNIRDLEPIVRKPARGIQTIRKLAAQTVGNDVMAYHQGIYFQAARRLADFDPANPMTSKELARLGHILLSMAMIAGKLEQDKVDGQPVMTPVQADQIAIVDEKARIVLIGDRKERLAPQPFEVFRHLYLNANQVCSKEELLKVALKGDYDERNLHTVIRRIRKVIEDDPEHPCFLVTEPNAGYRLILKPAS